MYYWTDVYYTYIVLRRCFFFFVKRVFDLSFSLYLNGQINNMCTYPYYRRLQNWGAKSQWLWAPRHLYNGFGVVAPRWHGVNRCRLLQYSTYLNIVAPWTRCVYRDNNRSMFSLFLRRILDVFIMVIDKTIITSDAGGGFKTIYNKNSKRNNNLYIGCTHIVRPHKIQYL